MIVLQCMNNQAKFSGGKTKSKNTSKDTEMFMDLLGYFLVMFNEQTLSKNLEKTSDMIYVSDIS